MDQSHLFVSVLFTGFFGGGVGAVANLLPERATDESALFLVISGFVVGGVVPLVRSHFTSEWFWSGIRQIFEPSGGARSGQTGYSEAESLAARGRVSEAIAAYERLLQVRPGEVEIHLRIARLLRDEGKLEVAAHRLRSARLEGPRPPARDAFLTRELVELYVHRIATPERALPELARMIELHPGTDDAEWAERERLRLREELGLTSQGRRAGPPDLSGSPGATRAE